MAKVVNAFQARTRFGEILEEVRYKREPYIVQRNGRPVVAILDIEIYNSIEPYITGSKFIEEYTKERVKEFIAEDKVNNKIATKVKKLLK